MHTKWDVRLQPRKSTSDFEFKSPECSAKSWGGFPTSNVTRNSFVILGWSCQAPYKVISSWCSVVLFRILLNFWKSPWCKQGKPPILLPEIIDSTLDWFMVTLTFQNETFYWLQHLSDKLSHRKHHFQFHIISRSSLLVHFWLKTRSMYFYGDRKKYSNTKIAQYFSCRKHTGTGDFTHYEL